MKFCAQMNITTRKILFIFGDNPNVGGVTSSRYPKNLQMYFQESFGANRNNAEEEMTDF